MQNACPRVSLCPIAGSDPMTKGDLSTDIHQPESAI
ncbi:Rz1-like lysis system protein LysC [Enterobacter roggenkampii]|nr:Rz1-like lysis system protein LysC [Enterobacter roggenkampii]MCE5971331.1 Rz1-like lysis system protein LysC [Enterobacter roggenkampii]UHY24835.1 Rz1-like lysis system protein LysC [Enterobacter roggenkampii]